MPIPSVVLKCSNLRPLRTRWRVAGEVVVEVRAAGINPADTYMRSGTYAIRPKLLLHPGWRCRRRDFRGRSEMSRSTKLATECPWGPRSASI